MDYTNIKEKMEKAINSYAERLAEVRAGRANPSILNKVKIDYYGTPTPINQVAGVSVPEARLIVIQPWDASILKEIEKAILAADIGINPNNDGKVIRLAFPELNEERRKEIVKDIVFLEQKSELATKDDIEVVNDLIDTLRANLDSCVGMAANMIGIKKRILVFTVGDTIIPMINPIILKKEMPYKTEESCLSLTGFRETIRYEKIEVEYFDINFKKHKQVFTGFTAQIIQHEVDHFEGIII